VILSSVLVANTPSGAFWFRQQSWTQFSPFRHAHWNVIDNTSLLTKFQR
jgi:hypothetical protein